MADIDVGNHQAADINLRGVIWGGMLIVAGILIAASAAYLLWQRWNEPGSGANAVRLPEISPPVLQAAPQEDRVRYIAEKQKLLESWEWIDQDKGIARIPVAEAMRILAARGGQTEPLKEAR